MPALPWTAKKQEQIAAALDYALRCVATTRNARSVAEPDQAEGRIVRLQRLQEGQGTTRPEAKQAPQQVPLEHLRPIKRGSVLERPGGIELRGETPIGSLSFPLLCWDYERR